MKLSLQEGLLPGTTLAESLGVEGCEISGWSKPFERIPELEKAFEGRTIKVSSVCGQTTCDFLDPRSEKTRRQHG